MSITFDYVGPTVGTSFAATVTLPIMYAKVNAFTAQFSLTYHKSVLGNLKAKIIMSDRGSCCTPKTEVFEITKLTYDTNNATVTYTPISYMLEGDSDIKISIYGTILEDFTNREFTAAVTINGKTCNACTREKTLDSVEMPDYDVSIFQIPPTVKNTNY